MSFAVPEVFPSGGFSCFHVCFAHRCTAFVFFLWSFNTWLLAAEGLNEVGNV